MNANQNDMPNKFILTQRQKLLLPIVMLGAFFEGFDFMVINLTLPYISKDMNIGTQTTGMVLSIVAVGALLAFFVVRLADKYGRRPIFLSAVVIYAVFSALTALTRSIETFVACQFIARVFLVTCLNVGFVIMSEEFGSEMRGRAIGLFESAAVLGAIFPSIFLPVFAKTFLHWRGLFLLGGLPLILIILYWRRLPETEIFLRTRKTGGQDKASQPGFLAVFAPPYRSRIIMVMALWFFMYFVYATAMSFFSYRVVNELGWEASRVGIVTGVAAIVGLLGFYAVGKAMDSWGRKKTGVVFFLCATAAVICTFQVHSYAAVFAADVVGTFFVGTLLVICATICNELFPTAIRANATAWSNNIMGRTGAIIVPTLAGTLAKPLHGIGNAVSVLVLSGIICAVIIGFFIPETLGYRVPEYETPEISA